MHTSRTRRFRMLGFRSPRPGSVAALVALIFAALPRSVAGQDSSMARAARYMATQVEEEDMVRVPMRDGIRLNATLFFAKGKPRQNLPTVLIFNPYLTKGMVLGFGPRMEQLLENGYAVAIINSRGRYFSEGTYTYMGGSGNDTYDTIDWLATQTWSNGKVGAIGCSSSAEEQHKMNAMQNPHFAAAVPMSSGAGIGKVGPYDEMGNFYRGGIFQNLWLSWYHGAGYKYKPSFPAGLSHEDMVRLNRYWNLEPETIPKVNFDSAVWTLPEYAILRNIGSAPSDLDEFLTWQVNDPRWKSIDFGGEGDRSGAPTLYVNAWYNVSTGPNVAMYEYQSKNAANAMARNNMFMIIAPTLHCQQGSMESEHTIVGQRDMGDARYDYSGFILRWFDHWLKGVDNGVTKEPKVRVYTMGANQWRTFDTWPPPEARPVRYYLDSDGGANTRSGNGRLTIGRPAKSGEDKFAYDPLHPTPSAGGQVCCFAAAPGGSFDQSEVESRPDVLVYTLDVLKSPVEVTGSIPVSVYLSSDVKDTDLMVTLVDVYPDGRAFNLDGQALRVRWREGYDHPAFMEPNHVYKVDLPPLVTSNAFLTGHRIRLAIASSGFPQLQRNLNTGGNNYDEKDAVTAHNVIHHGPAYLSSIVLPVVPTKVAAR